jgi:hypothetical protein
MFNDYSDIRDRIAEPPKWWDERGVPRYDDFTPRQVADVYTQEAALVEIACSACHRLLHVSFSNIDEEPLKKYGTPLADRIREGEIVYGDPPWHLRCPDGPSMTCYELRVLQYWIRGHNSGAWSGDWRRNSSLEIDLPGLREWEARGF